MKKLMLMCCLLFCLFAAAACGEANNAENSAIYLDENGYCNFGSWAAENDLNLNGAQGWATLYMKSPGELDEWLEENDLAGKISGQELQENWSAAILARLQCPDSLLEDLYNADTAGIAKFRAYGDDYLAEELAAEKARTGGEPPSYIDQNGAYDVGAWGDYDASGVEDDMTKYAATDEALLAFIEAEGNEAVYTVDGLRQHYAFSIIDIAGTSDTALQKLYGADQEGINKFRAYYNEVFCQVKPES